MYLSGPVLQGWVRRTGPSRVATKSRPTGVDEGLSVQTGTHYLDTSEGSGVVTYTERGPPRSPCPRDTGMVILLLAEPVCREFRTQEGGPSVSVPTSTRRVSVSPRQDPDFSPSFGSRGVEGGAETAVTPRTGAQCRHPQHDYVRVVVSSCV